MSIKELLRTELAALELIIESRRLELGITTSVGGSK